MTCVCTLPSFYQYVFFVLPFYFYCLVDVILGLGTCIQILETPGFYFFFFLRRYYVLFSYSLTVPFCFACFADDPELFHNLPVGVQLIGRTQEEEGVIAMGEIVDNALKALKA